MPTGPTLTSQTIKSSNHSHSEQANRSILIFMRKPQFDTNGKIMPSKFPQDWLVPEEMENPLLKLGTELDTREVSNSTVSKSDLVGYKPELSFEAKVLTKGKFAQEILSIPSKLGIVNQAIVQVLIVVGCVDESFLPISVADNMFKGQAWGSGLDCLYFEAPFTSDCIVASGSNAKLTTYKITLPLKSEFQNIKLVDTSLDHLSTAFRNTRNIIDHGIWDNDSVDKLIEFGAIAKPTAPAAPVSEQPDVPVEDIVLTTDSTRNLDKKADRNAGK